MKLKYASILAVLLCIALVCVLTYNNVSRDITSQDQQYIQSILAESGYELGTIENNHIFEDQIIAIRAVQDAILTQTPKQQIIPLGTSREPADLYKREGAFCGDRSRFMDKALRLAGFEVRYASIYETSKIKQPVLALLSRDKDKVRSHAMIEVKTQKGWMMVDSVTRWIALTKDGAVYSFEEWQNTSKSQNMNWIEQPGNIYFILENDFTYIYGLYSRHGKFYPPYWPIPDVNWPELSTNF